MHRRHILAAALGGAAAGLASPAVSQSTRTMRLAAVGPATGADRLADRVAAMSGGSLRIDVREVDEGAAAYDAVLDGDFDMVAGAEEAQRARHPAHALFTSTPGGMTAEEFESWISNGGGASLWAELGAKSGMQPFIFGDLGARPTTLAAPLSSLADFSRARIAAAGLAADLWRAVGAANVTEAVSARDGRRAAVFDAPLTVARAEGAAALTPAFTRPHAALSLNVNQSVYRGLGGETRAILDLAILAEHAATRAERMAAALDAPAAEAAAPADLLTAMRGAADGLLDAIADHDALGAAIVFSYRKHQTGVEQWTEIGQGAYVAARAEALS